MRSSAPFGPAARSDGHQALEQADPSGGRRQLPGSCPPDWRRCPAPDCPIRPGTQRPAPELRRLGRPRRPPVRAQIGPGAQPPRQSCGPSAHRNTRRFGPRSVPRPAVAVARRCRGRHRRGGGDVGDLRRSGGPRRAPALARPPDRLPSGRPGVRTPRPSGGVVETKLGRFAVANGSDPLVLGRWTCGPALPAVLRPRPTRRYGSGIGGPRRAPLSSLDWRGISPTP